MPMVRHAAEMGWKPVARDEALERSGGTFGLLFPGQVGVRDQCYVARANRREDTSGELGCSELSERSITVGDDNDDRNRHC